MFLEAGPQYNTSTLQKQLQDTLNSYAGDIALKHRIIVLPPGSKPSPQKDLSFGKDVDLAIMEYFYPVLQIQPQEIGQMPGGRTSGLGGRGATEQMAESISNQRTKPDRNRWKGRFDRQIQSRAGFAQPDLEWKWIVDQDQDDPDKRAAAEASDVSHGIRTIDDIVTENGGDPWGLPLTSTPIFVMPTGIIPLDPSVQAPAPIAPGGSVPGAPAGESDTEPNAPSGAPAEAAPEAGEPAKEPPKPESEGDTQPAAEPSARRALAPHRASCGTGRRAWQDHAGIAPEMAYPLSRRQAPLDLSYVPACVRIPRIRSSG